jgi:SsrA-binding protein
MLHAMARPKAQAKSSDVRPIAQNRKARFEFEILDELECGIVLGGTEVKSLRQGQCSLQEAYAHLRSGELYLIGAHIPEYAHGNVHNHEPVRDRKLLVHRRELRAWEKRVKERGVTMIPLAIYFRGSLVKVQLGLGKGKKLYDKRASEREKSDRREIDRALSRRGR